MVLGRDLVVRTNRRLVIHRNGFGDIGAAGFVVLAVPTLLSVPFTVIIPSKLPDQVGFL